MVISLYLLRMLIANIKRRKYLDVSRGRDKI